MSIWETLKDEGMGLWNQAGKYAKPAMSFISAGNPITTALAGAYHTGHGIYDAITGNREGAVNNGSAALLDALKLNPLAAMIMGGIDVGSGAIKAATGVDTPTTSEALGSGSNGLIDDIFGKEDRTQPPTTSTAQGVGGTIGTLATMALGPLGMIAGGGIGRAIGGLFD